MTNKTRYFSSKDCNSLCVKRSRTCTACKSLKKGITERYTGDFDARRVIMLIFNTHVGGDWEHTAVLGLVRVLLGLVLEMSRVER